VSSPPPPPLARLTPTKAEAPAHHHPGPDRDRAAEPANASVTCSSRPLARPGAIDTYDRPAYGNLSL